MRDSGGKFVHAGADRGEAAGDPGGLQPAGSLGPGELPVPGGPRAMRRKPVGLPNKRHYVSRAETGSSFPSAEEVLEPAPSYGKPCFWYIPIKVVGLNRFAALEILR